MPWIGPRPPHKWQDKLGIISSSVWPVFIFHHSIQKRSVVSSTCGEKSVWQQIVYHTQSKTAWFSKQHLGRNKNQCVSLSNAQYHTPKQCGWTITEHQIRYFYSLYLCLFWTRSSQLLVLLTLLLHQLRAEFTLRGRNKAQQIESPRSEQQNRKRRRKNKSNHLHVIFVFKPVENIQCIGLDIHFKTTC